MRIEVYKCENCGKETQDYCREKGWIHIGERLVISNGETREGSPFIARSCDSITAEEGWGLDFCSLKCFIRWLYLSKDTDNRKNYDKDAFLKEAIKSIMEDGLLREMIVDHLNSEKNK